jgi:hypothetical protein
VSSCCCWNFSKQKLEKLDVKIDILGISLNVEENPNNLSASDKYQINFLYPQKYQQKTQEKHKKFQTAQANISSPVAADQKNPTLEKKAANSQKFDESHEYFLHLVALVSAFCIELNNRNN